MDAIVNLACKELTDDELATLNLCIALDSDPRGRLGSEKYLSLFDTTDATGTPKMNDVTKQAIARVVARRFPV